MRWWVAVLLPGDFIADRDYRPRVAATAEDEIAGILGKLRAPLGVYAVLGNHDWWHNGPKFAAALRKQGIRVLENEAVPLPGTALWIAAVGDHSTGHSHALATLTFLPPDAQAIVYMHDPASLFELAGRSICRASARPWCQGRRQGPGPMAGWSTRATART